MTGARSLPRPPEGMVWHWEELDANTVTIALLDKAGRNHGQQRIAVDLYGWAGVRDACAGIVERDSRRLWLPLK